ncbi:MAG: MFS transporter [Deltaproteobacteria bacterium]|nr:MFS transporter [Deltaproteobacteria bacterium]
MSAKASVTPSDSAANSLPLSRVALFGLGDWGPSTASTAVLFFLPFFLTDIARIQPSVAAWVLLAGGAWDALCVPLIGAWSDRTRTRIGRRRPFMLAGALPFALAFASLWWIPPWHGAARAVYFALAYLAFDTAFAAVQVPYASLTPELSLVPADRTRLNAARAVVSMVGGLVAAASIPAAIHAFEDRARGYAVTMAVVGLVGMVPFLILGTRLRERPARDQGPAPHPLREIRGALQTPAVREAALVYLAAWVTVSVVASMFEYFITHVLGMVGKLDVILGLVQCSALVSVPLVAWASERFGRRKTLAVGALFWSAVLFGLMLLPREHATWGYGLALLCGPGIAASHVIPWTLIADAVEADEKHSGRRREGAVYGVLGFAQKAAVALAVSGSQAVLGRAGYNASLRVQSEQVQFAIRMLFSLGPAVLLLVLAFAMVIRRGHDQRDRSAAMQA